MKIYSLKHLVTKLVIIASLLLVPLASTPLFAQAVDPNEDVCSNLADPNNPPAICQKNTTDDPITGDDGLLSNIIQIVAWITAIASIILIIIGGLKYILSGGDSNGVQSAKNTILYAIVGLVIALFAQIIVSLVLTNV